MTPALPPPVEGEWVVSADGKTHTKTVNCPCCQGKGGSGDMSVPIQYTDCQCGYPYTLDPMSPSPPPQPAGGFFPTIWYYKADLSGDCNDCYGLAIDNNPCAAAIALTSVTVANYCTSPLTVPLYYCPDFIGAKLWDGEYALCDYTFSTSDGSTFTIRRFLRIQITVTCSSCITIDETWLSENGLDPEIYASWVGLELCYGASASINRSIQYKVISQSLAGGATRIDLLAIPTVTAGGTLTYPCDTSPCSVVSTCWADGGRVAITGGAVGCTNIVLASSSQGTFSQDIYCCATQNFSTAPSGGCGCMPSNEKLHIPGTC